MLIYYFAHCVVVMGGKEF